MFLGYNRNQKGELFISLVADTEQELKNYPCVSFEKIEETKDKYILYNGKYLKETDIDVNENICAQRADRFYQETDKFLFKKLENVIDIRFANLYHMLKEVGSNSPLFYDPISILLYFPIIFFISKAKKALKIQIVTANP